MRHHAIVAAIVFLGGLVFYSPSVSPPHDLIVAKKPLTHVTMKGKPLREQYFINLGKLPDLNSIDLEGSHFKAVWLRHLNKDKIKHLNLSGTLIEDRHEALLKTFVNLKSLTLNNTSLNEECLHRLAIR